MSSFDDFARRTNATLDGKPVYEANDVQAVAAISVMALREAVDAGDIADEAAKRMIRRMNELSVAISLGMILTFNKETKRFVARPVSEAEGSFDDVTANDDVLVLGGEVK